MIKELKHDQGSGSTLIPLINYLRNDELPEDDKSARSIVFESSKFKLDVGMLYYENPAFHGRYCVVGQAKRAPHWGVQSRFRVIYIYMSVCLSCPKMRRRNYVNAHAQSQIWATYDTRVIHFYCTIELI